MNLLHGIQCYLKGMPGVKYIYKSVNLHHNTPSTYIHAPYSEFRRLNLIAPKSPIFNHNFNRLITTEALIHQHSPSYPISPIHPTIPPNTQQTLTHQHFHDYSPQLSLIISSYPTINHPLFLATTTFCPLFHLSPTTYTRIA